MDGDPALATGDPSTVQAGDEIDGGDGTDTLVWTATPNAAGTAVVGTSNVEGLKIYNNTNNDAYSIDANMMSGITDIYAMGGNATTTVTNTGLVNVHMISTSENVTVTKKATVGLGTSDAVTILGNNAATTSSATVDYDGAETVNLVAAGTIGSATRTLTITNDDLETLNITGDAAVNVTTTFTGAAASTQTATLDASEAGGVVRATVTRGTSSKSAITLSDNNDHLTMVSAISKDDVLVGGDGTDILETGDTLTYSSSATAQEGAGISGFETLRLQTGGSVDMRALTGDNDITTVVYEATGSVTKSAGITAISQLAAGTATLALATDGAADEITTTVGSSVAAGGVVATLVAADMETINVVSAGLTTDNTLTLSGATADVTTVNVSGRGIDLTVAGTSVATVDASGVAGLGSAFTLDASASEADMTVTGSSVVPTDTDSDLADDITTGEGDDTITTGDYNDNINAGEGNNTITAGDGDHTLTAGRGNDTITAGDGDNTINAGNGNNTVTVGDGTNGITVGSGDDTVTTGGTTTSSTVMDVNTVALGAGDDTFTGGGGRDVVTMGSGDDNVSTGGGADSIYMSDYDDDDVVNGGAGSDTLSASALATSAAMAVTGAQIQAAGVHVDVTPGATRTSTPQITGVESVYINANLADANDGGASDRETINFASSSGISNLYLVTTDGDAANSDSTLILNEIDAAAIHLQDDGANAALGQLTVVGTGQAALTIKGHDMADSTDIVVTETNAVTVTSYVDNATAAVTDTVFGNLTLDEAEAVTITGAGVSAVIGAQAFTVGTVSADAAESLTISSGSNMVLTVGAVDTAGDDLTSIDIDVSDDGTMALTSVTATAGTIVVDTMTIDVGVGGTFRGNGAIPALISADEITSATVTVGAAATMRADFLYAGTTTITASAGSVLDIDDIGVAGLESSVTINGRATLGGDLDLLGEATLNFSGLTAAAVTIDGDSAGDKTIIGNNSANTLNTGAGDDSVTGGAGIDTIDTGAGDDTINGGAGADEIDAGTGADVINGGLGVDTYAVSDADSAVDTAAAVTATTAGIDTVTVTDGDIFNFADRTEALNADAGAAVAVTLDDDTDDTTITELLAAMDAAVNADLAAEDVVLFYVTDTGDGGTNSWTGAYLVSALDDTISANDNVIKIVGSGVDANSTIAIDGNGEVVFTI